MRERKSLTSKSRETRSKKTGRKVILDEEAFEILRSTFMAFGEALPQSTENIEITMVEAKPGIGVVREEGPPEMEELIERKLKSILPLAIDERLTELGLKPQQVDDMNAEIQIRNYLKTFDRKKKDTVNLLDLMVNLNLPPDQIERIMDKLEKDGVKRIG